ncbi:MAG: cytochrome c [Vicinamibacterales bacterium]
MTTTLRFLVLAAGVAPAPALFAAPGQPSTAERQARTAGRDLFVEHCASCHGTSGRGDGPAADALRRRPSDLTTFSRANGGVFPSEHLRQVIDGRGVGAHGSVEMPVWGAVFRSTAGGEQAARTRIDAILAYLQSIQERTGF